VGERGGREGGGDGMAAEKVGCMRWKAKGSGEEGGADCYDIVEGAAEMLALWRLGLLRQQSWLRYLGRMDFG
jgi:hypothetical protein